MKRRVMRHGLEHVVYGAVCFDSVRQLWPPRNSPSWSFVKPSRVRLDVPCFLYTRTLVRENVWICLTTHRKFLAKTRMDLDLTGNN